MGVDTSASGIPASYARTVGRFDELFDESGAVRPHWEPMIKTWSTLGAGEIVRRQRVAERLLVAEGAGHVFHDDSEIGMSWGLDPVPYVIGASEWRDIERGLGQRTRVLDAVLDDLYGPRRLLLDGVIPTAAVMGSRAYQLAAVGVATPRPRLTLYAADLVRDGAGQWLLLRDHTDAPTGCGYALMNRTVLSRLYPEPFRHLGVSPLSGWFADLRSALSSVAPSTVTGPRTILLGPKPQRPGFVEASYLATHLGYHLASSGDLITRGGRVWLRTLGGLEQIDVVFRRLADTGSDPLELRPSGLGGVTGLLQAVREGNVGVANALGSGVADRLWLQPFLADAARHLLGETLELASIDTWWVGDRDTLAAVKADPDTYVFHDTDPVSPAASVIAAHLSDSEADGLARSNDGCAPSIRGATEDRVCQHTGGCRWRVAEWHREHPCADRSHRRRGHRVAGWARSPRCARTTGDQLIGCIRQGRVGAHQSLGATGGNEFVGHRSTRSATSDRPARLVADAFRRGVVLARPQRGASRSCNADHAADHRPHR